MNTIKVLARRASCHEEGNFLATIVRYTRKGHEDQILFVDQALVDALGEDEAIIRQIKKFDEIWEKAFPTGTPGDHGTALQAIEFVLDLANHRIVAGQEREFFNAWVQGDLDDWPEFYQWLEKQKNAA